MVAITVQIIGTKKCAETRKAERFFKERGVAVHFRDLRQDGLSAGEIRNVANAVGGIDELLDRQGKEYERRNLRWISQRADEALQKWPLLLKTPVVRYGKRATVGPAPEVWQRWIESA